MTGTFDGSDAVRGNVPGGAPEHLGRARHRARRLRRRGTLDGRIARVRRRRGGDRAALAGGDRLGGCFLSCAGAPARHPPPRLVRVPPLPASPATATWSTGAQGQAPTPTCASPRNTNASCAGTEPIGDCRTGVTATNPPSPSRPGSCFFPPRRAPRRARRSSRCRTAAPPASRRRREGPPWRAARRASRSGPRPPRGLPLHPAS